MRRSKIVVPLHFIWGTYQKLPLITPGIRERLYACICAEAKRHDIKILAVGGLEDHVHLAVMFPATIAIGEFMKQIKGVSSKVAKTELVGPDGFFRWQEGYGVYAFQEKLVPTVVEYIETQQERHERKNLWGHLEEMDEEAPPKVPTNN